MHTYLYTLTKTKIKLKREKETKAEYRSSVQIMEEMMKREMERQEESRYWYIVRNWDL